MRVSTIRSLERVVERATGESVEALRDTSVDQRRRDLQKRVGAPLRFESRFPHIGRGNVLRDRIATHGDVEAALTEALRDAPEAADRR